MAYLVFEHAGARRQVPLAQPVTIGRQNDCTIPLDDPRLSREHTKVWFDGRVWRVRDLDSKNGTYLNGELVREPRALNPGDQIKVGAAVFTFQLDATDAPPGPAAPPAPRRATDAVRREQLAAHARQVRDTGAGPGGLVRAVLNLALVAVFAAATCGFRGIFLWAFDRVMPQ